MKLLELDDAALVLGAVLIVAGAFVLAPWVGLIVAGFVLVAAGYFLTGDQA